MTMFGHLLNPPKEAVTQESGTGIGAHSGKTPEEQIQEKLDLNAQRELGNDIRERARIADFSPGAELEDDELKNISLKYPLDMAGRADYQHVMRICIYKQVKSTFSDGKLLGRVSEESFSQYAGDNLDRYLDLDAKTAAAAQASGNLATTIGNIAITLITKGRGRSAAARRAGQNIVQSGVVGTTVETIGKLGGATIAQSLKQFRTLRTTEEKPCAYITLYMPETMQVVDRHDYDAASFTEASGLAGLFNFLNTSGNPKAGEIPATVGEQIGVFGKGAVDAALYSNGYALNPVLQVLYKGTKNREFIFSFKLVPRNEDEAIEILAILRTLRFHASPEYELNVSNSRYFIPPSDFDIEFFIGAERNLSMPRIAKCVLSNIDVNYAPSGQYSTYSNGVPTEITCQMTFTETVVLTKEDIKIGY